jgi:chitodextrinase
VAANVPNAPVIGTAAQTGATTANCVFTASTDNGGSAITSYTATSTPGNVTKNGAGPTLAVTGLTTATQYTFKVFATNANGNSLLSAASNQITTA